MANTQAICNSFKRELLLGHHNFGTGVIRAATTKDTISAALYLTSATINASTTAYTTSGEVTGTNYTAGGALNITNATEPALDSSIAHWTPSASISYPTVTLGTAFNCVLLYNDTQGDKAIAVFTFGDQTITAGTFTLTMPTNDGSTGLIRLN
jgi:hypothetical protein